MQSSHVLVVGYQYQQNHDCRSRVIIHELKNKCSTYLRCTKVSRMPTWLTSCHYTSCNRLQPTQELLSSKHRCGSSNCKLWDRVTANVRNLQQRHGRIQEKEVPSSIGNNVEHLSYRERFLLDMRSNTTLSECFENPIHIPSKPEFTRLEACMAKIHIALNL